MMTNHLNEEAFFKQEIPEDYRQDWTKQIAQSKQEVRRQDKGAMLIRLGDEYVAWPSLSCLTVVSAHQIHAIPHRSHPVLKGLAAMRGQLLPCCSLARLLEIKTSSVIHEQQLILLGSEQHPIGMLVEHIETYIRFHHDDEQDLPSNLMKTGVCFSQSMLDWKEQKIPLLDDKLIISAFERCMQ